jgi:hypothetical protein
VVVEGTEMKYFLSAVKQKEGCAPLTTLKLVGCTAELSSSSGYEEDACFVLQTPDGELASLFIEGSLYTAPI